jgi:hypothetical protein
MTFSTNFIPSSKIIQDITRANPGVVTTTTDHGYLTGIFVRIVLPADFGMQQVDNQIYKITVLTSSTFAINQNTSNFDAFSLVVTTQLPQVIPVGSDALSILEGTENAGNIIPET